jgi:hypothetical protein
MDEAEGSPAQPTRQSLEPDEGGGDHEGKGGRDESQHGGSALEPLGFIGFVGLIFAVATGVVGGLLLLWTSARFFAAGLLITAGICLFGVWLGTRIGQTRWFYAAMTAVVALALMGSGVYILVRHAPTHPVPQAKSAQIPKLSFVLTSPAVVPWCKAYSVTAEGSIPRGYELLLFDASSDAQGNPSSFYNYDGMGKPVPRVGNEWVFPDVFIGDRYVTGKDGKYLVRHGKHVSNAGFAAVAVVELVKDEYAQIIQSVKAPLWFVNRPPPPLAEARLQVKRNGNAALCSDLSRH